MEGAQGKSGIASEFSLKQCMCVLWVLRERKPVLKGRCKIPRSTFANQSKEECKFYNFVNIIMYSSFVRFDSLKPCQQFFSYVGTGPPGLNQY